MKLKIGLMMLPLLGAAGMAVAEGSGQPGASAAEPVAAQARARAQQAVEMRKAVRRQGTDLRHCLELKDSRAIIRCAEPGRKP